MQGTRLNLSGLDKLAANVFAELGPALMDAGDEIAALGIQNAPIKEGFLRQSIRNEGLYRVAKAQSKSSKLVVRVAARRIYAKVQHENETFKHPKGGRAKYLTAPMAEKKDQLRAYVLEAAKRGLAKSKVS